MGIKSVQIHVPKIVGYKKLYDTPDSKTHPLMEESLPPRYNANTKLRLDVQPGPNEQNYDLKTE